MASEKKESKPAEKPKAKVEAKKEPDSTQKLFQMSNISLWLDRYEDIFSDFDPRPYSQRTLSDDFLHEAKKVSREKLPGKIELRLLVPTQLRHLYNESVIKKRILEHFKGKYEDVKKEARKILNQGLFFLIIGIVLMLITTYLIITYYEKSFTVVFLSTLFEPASWFLFWEGLRLVIFDVKEKKPDLSFYEKMAKCEIRFLSY